MNPHFKRAGLAALLALSPYLFGLRHPFVYDDHAVIEENAFLREPGAWTDAVTLKTVFDPRIPDSGRPVAILSYLLDLSVWGARPFGFRITNLILHAFVVAFLCALVRQLGGSSFLSIVAALLFGLHPLLLEAVHSPAFREDLLVTLGILGFLLLVLRGHPRLALLVLIPAVAAKESGVVAPALMLWGWICFPAQRPPVKQAISLTLISGAVAALFVILWALSGTLQGLSASAASPPLPFPTNLWTAPWLFLRLWRFLLWPAPLRPDHIISPVETARDPRFIMGVVLSFIFIACIWRLRRRSPLLAFALGWVAIAFLPVSNLVPLHNAFAERYAYLPCVGFAAALAWGVGQISFPRARAVVVASLAAAFVAGILVPLRSWRSDYDLWQRALAHEPRSARAWVWTGLELKRRGLREEALQHFQRAWALNPRETTALVNMAILLGEHGQFEEAERLLRRAAEQSPKKAEVWWNLAVCLNAQGKISEAEHAARRALEQNPWFEPARRLFGAEQPGNE